LPVQTFGRVLRDGYDLDARLYLAKDAVNQAYLVVQRLASKLK